MSDLTDYQRDFLDLLVHRQALRFGDFTLKSGRRSAFFLNTGCFHYGSDLDAIGSAYAERALECFGEAIDTVFGPAYKGIPLALATAQALEKRLGRPVAWSFDRKEAKTHGEAGSFVGAPLAGGARVLLVDDVITAGTALRECMRKLQGLDIAPVGILVGVDREEAGPGGGRATHELSADTGLPVAAILTISAAVAWLRADPSGAAALSAAQAEQILSSRLASA